MPRGWIRIIATASTCLLLGAIINIAVAWACVCWSDETDLEILTHPAHGAARWAAPTPADWPAADSLARATGLGITNCLVGGPARDEDSRSQQWVLQAGWPARSMYVARFTVHPKVHTWAPVTLSDISEIESETWRDGLALPVWAKGTFTSVTGRYLPTQVIWSGFAINSSLYASVLWLISGAPFRLRRRLRIRRGLCPACAYPIGTSPVCTECGEALAVVGVPWSKRGFASAGHASAPSADEPV